MSKELEIKKWYLENYNRFDKIVTSDTLKDFRKNSSVKFDESQFPTKKVEEWKYTNVTPILKQNFIPSPLAKPSTEKISIHGYKIQNLDVHLLVFVNGIFNKELSDIGNVENGIIIDNLFNLTNTNPKFIHKFFQLNNNSENSFNLLNNIFTYDGFVVYIPKNKIIEKPIHVLNISSGSGEKPLIQPRNFIIAEANTHANIISEYIGKNGSEYFTNILTDITLDENANISYYKLQKESDNAFHVDKTEITQKDSSVLNNFSLSFGSKIARNDINAKLDGKNIECHLYGLYLGNNDQHIDNHTFINHIKPNCMSNEMYKGILDDKAHGVFSGKILVDKIAQKTNSYQSNKAVLLSEDAGVDAKPQLEIYADDVKCTHGATVGKLDEEAYFYIRSRGVPAESARSMLIRAFIDDIVSQISIDELKEKVNHTIFEHLHREEF